MHLEFADAEVIAFKNFSAQLLVFVCVVVVVVIVVVAGKTVAYNSLANEEKNRI